MQPRNCSGHWLKGSTFTIWVGFIQGRELWARPLYSFINDLLL
jgi:hypothetical protein